MQKETRSVWVQTCETNNILEDMFSPPVKHSRGRHR